MLPFALLAVLVWGAVLRSDVAVAHDGFSDGDCWTGAPVQCAANWAPNTNYGYKVTPYWTGSLQSEAGTALTAAALSWTTSAGPQVFSTSTPSNPYMIAFTFPWSTYSAPTMTYTQALNNGAIAVVANYSTSGTWCYSTACVIDHSGVYYNFGLRTTCTDSVWSAFMWQYIFAHEFGHSQGLDDHTTGDILMNQSSTWPNYPCLPNTSVNGPTSQEIGLPISSGASSCGTPRGVQCIFRWPNN